MRVCICVCVCVCAYVCVSACVRACVCLCAYPLYIYIICIYTYYIYIIYNTRVRCGAGIGPGGVGVGLERAGLGCQVGWFASTHTCAVAVPIIVRRADDDACSESLERMGLLLVLLTQRFIVIYAVSLLFLKNCRV
jgi:hypothetical protein